MKPNQFVRLADMAEIRNDLRKPINSTERNSRISGKPQSKLYPYYGATGQVGMIDSYLSDGEYVLVGEDGAPFLDYTKDKAYIINGKGWVNNHAHVLKAKEKRSTNRFLLHYLNFFNYEGFVSGTTRLKLTKGKLEQIPVPNFTFDEQVKIATRIDTLFNRVTSGVEELKTAEAFLSTYKQSILNSAIRGKLVLQDPQDEPASVLLEKIKAEKEKLIAEKKIKKEKPLPPISEEEIPFDLPDGWACVRLGDILSVGTGATPLKSNKDYYHNGKIPWLTSSVTSKPFVTEDVSQFITTKALEETNCKLFPSGTLLVAMYGEGKTRGQVTELTFEATTNQAVAAILFDDSTKMLKDFVKLAFLERYEKIRMEAMGGNQPNLSTGTIKSQILPIPPFEEQVRIVNKVRESLVQIENLTTLLKDNLGKSSQLKQSILKKAFEGEL